VTEKFLSYQPVFDHLRSHLWFTGTTDFLRLTSRPIEMIYSEEKKDIVMFREVR
jgi:hypothetical protein